MNVARRTVLGAGAALGTLAVSGTARAASAPAPSALASVSMRPRPESALGPLVDMGDLALPRGFSFVRVGTIGVEPLLTGPGGSVVGRTPSNLDGTGCFDYRGHVRLVRNHEIRPMASAHTVPLVPGTVYDDSVPMGGCTVVRTERDGTFREQWVGLSGTIRNCAGGDTPWGSWLTCEEDTTKAGTVVTGIDGKQYTVKKDHGYVFEVFPRGPEHQVPEPITAWGRGVWEGAAIDPTRRYAYLTEDTGDGLFYRWTAPQRRSISAGIARRFGPTDGVLEALAVLRSDGTPYVHYAELTAADLNRPKRTRWVRPGIEDRQAQTTDLRKQFTGVTRHPKIEGCWSDGWGLWFTCSFAYDAEQAKYPSITQNQGMVFRYDFWRQTLTLKVYYEKGNVFDGPDNITVSPFGGVVIAEDGDGDSHLVSWTPSRGSQALALNRINDSEWAGPCFTRRGDLLFASIQSTATFAIRGDFRRVC